MLKTTKHWWKKLNKAQTNLKKSYVHWASLVAQLVKNLPAVQRPGFSPWVGKVPWRREWLPTPGFWPGEFHGRGADRLQSMGWQRVRHDWATFTSLPCLEEVMLLECPFYAKQSTESIHFYQNLNDIFLQK